MSSSTIKSGKTVSLHLVLVVSVTLQVFAAVGVIGWLSIRNGQQAVNDVATQLRSETSDRIKQQIESYLNEARKMEVYAQNFHFLASLQRVAEICRIRKASTS